MSKLILFVLLTGCTIFDTRNAKLYLCKKQLEENSNLQKTTEYKMCNILPYSRTCPCYGVVIKYF